jgi:hypothetical protein
VVLVMVPKAVEQLEPQTKVMPVEMEAMLEATTAVVAVVALGK